MFASDCRVCGELPDALGEELCTQCRAGLPWNHLCCERCARPMPHRGICGQCLLHQHPLYLTRATFAYAAPIDALLPRFKFHRDLAAGRLLSALMLESLRDAPRPQAIVPVPLHRDRLRQRGYDQALELAKPLARALKIPLRADALQRVRATAPQSELDAEARQKNLRGAFAPNLGAFGKNGALPNHVALVDDVMTTGATLHAAARALRAAGVQRVDAWVCARVA